MAKRTLQEVIRWSIHTLTRPDAQIGSRTVPESIFAVSPHLASVLPQIASLDPFVNNLTIMVRRILFRDGEEFPFANANSNQIFMHTWIEHLPEKLKEQEWKCFAKSGNKSGSFSRIYKMWHKKKITMKYMRNDIKKSTKKITIKNMQKELKKLVVQIVHAQKFIRPKLLESSGSQICKINKITWTKRIQKTWWFLE